jgi:hypothetical protein
MHATAGSYQGLELLILVILITTLAVIFLALLDKARDHRYSIFARIGFHELLGPALIGLIMRPLDRQALADRPSSRWIIYCNAPHSGTRK